MKSMNCIILQNEITDALQAMYASITSIDICKKNLENELTGNKKILDVYPNEYPYCYFNIDYNDYVSRTHLLKNKYYEQCIVNLITAIENCCYEILERYYILNFKTIKDEDASLSFKEIADYSNNGSDLEIGICKILVERKLRNEKTIDMLEKVGRITKNGFVKNKQEFVNTIDRYSLLRNCIIHNQARVTKDLHDNYEEIYGSINGKILVNHKDCVELSQSILRLMNEYDKQYYKTVIQENDYKALAKELFIMKGYESSTSINPVLNKIAMYKGSDEIISVSISEVKKNKKDIQYLQIRSKANNILSSVLI
jgi:hypothetical protein